MILASAGATSGPSSQPRATTQAATPRKHRLRLELAPRTRDSLRAIKVSFPDAHGLEGLGALPQSSQPGDRQSMEMVHPRKRSFLFHFRFAALWNSSWESDRLR